MTISISGNVEITGNNAVIFTGYLPTANQFIILNRFYSYGSSYGVGWRQIGNTDQSGETPLGAVAFGANILVAPTYSGNIVTSEDAGVHWSLQVVPQADRPLWIWDPSRPYAQSTLISYFNDRFIWNTRANTISTSTDGRTWQSQLLPGPSGLSARYRLGLAAIGDSYFVIPVTPFTSESTGFYRTADALTWQFIPVTFGTPTYPTVDGAQASSMAYGDGKYIFTILAYSGNYSPTQSVLLISTDNALTWTRYIIPYYFNAMAYGEGLFVAIGRTSWPTGSVATFYSTDGINWNFRTLSGINQLGKSLVYSQGVFCASGAAAAGNDRVDRILVSADGINWTIQTLTPPPIGLATTYLPSIYDAAITYAEFQEGQIPKVSGYILVSGYYCNIGNDLVNWDQFVIDYSNVNSRVFYGRDQNRIFVLRDFTSSTALEIAVSDDNGDDWSELSTQSLSFQDRIYFYLDGEYFCTNNSSGRGQILISQNGIDWSVFSTLPGSVPDNYFLAWNDDYSKFVAKVGIGLSGAWSTTSVDLVTWTEPTILVPAATTYPLPVYYYVTLSQLAYGNGVFVILCGETYINDGRTVNLGRLFSLVSTDGVNWSNVNDNPLPVPMAQSRITNVSMALVYGGNRFVLVDNYTPYWPNTNLVLISADGRYWETYSRPQRGYGIAKFLYGFDRFVLTDAGGTMDTVDGINWNATLVPGGIWVDMIYVPPDNPPAPPPLPPAPPTNGGNVKGFVLTASSNFWFNPNNRLSNGIFGYGNSVSQLNYGNVSLSQRFNVVAYGQGTYVATLAQDSGNIGRIQYDTANWTFRSLPASNVTTNWDQIIYANSRFIISSSTSNRVAVSNDLGLTWVRSAFPLSPIPLQNDWGTYNIAYGNNLYVVAGQQKRTSTTSATNSVSVSANGVAWTTTAIPLSPGSSTDIWRNISYANNRFILTLASFLSNGNIRSQIATSNNGTTWQYFRSNQASALHRVAYVGNTYIAGGDNGIAYSQDLTNWQTSNIITTGPNSFPFQTSFYFGSDAVYSGNTITFFSSTGAVVSQDNGRNFTYNAFPAAPSGIWNGAAYGDGT